MSIAATRWNVVFQVTWGYDGKSWSANLAVAVTAPDRVEALRSATEALEGQTKFEVSAVLITEVA